MAFFGIKTVYRCLDLSDRLQKIIRSLIEDGFSRFVLQTNGEFDVIAVNVLHSLYLRYPQIEIEVHSTRETFSNDFIFPEIRIYFYEPDYLYLKPLVTKKDKEIIAESDFFLCYIDTTIEFEDEFAVLKYLKTQNKTIVNLFEETPRK